MVASLLPLTPERKLAFLDALSKHGIARAAAREASPGCGPRGAVRTFEDERERDSEFAKAWEDALEEAKIALDREIHRRAVEGYEEERTDSQGRVSTVRRFSDACLIARARMLDPRYGERRIKAEVEVKRDFADLSKLTAEERDSIRRILEGALSRAGQ